MNTGLHIVPTFMSLTFLVAQFYPTENMWILRYSVKQGLLLNIMYVWFSHFCLWLSIDYASINVP